MVKSYRLNIVGERQCAAGLHCPCWERGRKCSVCRQREPTHPPMVSTMKMKRRPRMTHNTRPALTVSRAGTPWSVKEDQQLRDEHAQGLTVQQMAGAHERTLVGIEARLIRLELTGVVETAARTKIDPVVYISVEQLAKRYDIDPRTIWRWSRTGRLPKPQHIGPNVTRWRFDEVMECETRWKNGKAS